MANKKPSPRAKKKKPAILKKSRIAAIAPMPTAIHPSLFLPRKITVFIQQDESKQDGTKIDYTIKLLKLIPEVRKVELGTGHKGWMLTIHHNAENGLAIEPRIRNLIKHQLGL